VPVILNANTVHSISTIQLNLPHNHRDSENIKTVELMYNELLKRFDQGNALKKLDPIDDMEIEFDPETDEMDISELVKAKEKIAEELLKSEFQKVSNAQIELY